MLEAVRLPRRIRRPGAKAGGVGVGSATGPGAPIGAWPSLWPGSQPGFRCPAHAAWGPAKRRPLLLAAADSATSTQLRQRARAHSMYATRKFRGHSACSSCSVCDNASTMLASRLQRIAAVYMCGSNALRLSMQCLQERETPPLRTTHIACTPE